ncbi:tropomyosin Mac r 1.0101-like [Dermacentor albipictus]|uniref:tropomyosin Mac r 1.0101-like n=1 Tax=Dermacentor albipictus TaxID=60249 RepID=UPI0031FC9381
MSKRSERLSADRPTVEGSERASRSPADGDLDPDADELERLRCSSVQTEQVIAERNRRNARQPSAGYPGLAFGGSVFSSSTLMRFRLIANELHNITNVQLKRAEGEVSALRNRINALGENLGREETELRQASQEVSLVRMESQQEEGDGKEDGEMSLLDTQLIESKLRYEAVARQIALLDAEFEPTKAASPCGAENDSSSVASTSDAAAPV